MATINDPIIQGFMSEMRLSAERTTALGNLLEDLVFYYEENIEPLLASAANTDDIDEGRDNEGIPRRTVGDLKALFNHIKLFNIALNGTEGIVGVTALQGQSNTLAHDFAPVRSRRRFHVRGSLGRE